MREFTVENNGVNTNLVYEVKEKENVDSVILGMMENNRIIGLLPMTYTQIDKKKYLKYNITSKVTIEQFFERGVNKEKLTRCLSNILAAVSNAEDYMIELCDLIIDIKYIYVDIRNCDIDIICVPIVENTTDCNLEMFVKNIIFTSKFDQTENCDYVAKIISYLNSGVFSASEFKTVLDEILNEDEGKNIPVKNNPVIKREKPVVSVRHTETIVDASRLESAQERQVTPAVNIPRPTVSQAKPEVEKEKKEKKSIFGFLKKNKEPKTEKKSDKKSKGMSVPGMAIPGQEPVLMAQQPEEPMVIPGSQATPIQQQLQPRKQANYTQIDGNFGETTVLGIDGMGETTVLGLDSMEAYQTRAFLIRKKNQEKKYIDKEIYRIGKENSFVDYFIGDNTAISRSHANVITKGMEYFIIDMNSKNHTYVDGIMIQPNVETKIEPGMTLRLADEEFVFNVE